MARPPTRARLAGRYELGDVLGRGGMGEVRAGTDHRLGRPVAVKLLRADLAGEAEIRARFEAEARAAARLAHPNVVSVFDSGEEDGLPFIVMERLPGETLADEIARARLTPDSARRMGTQMLAALGIAHDAGICHRDVKPGNVLLAADGVWKVADFGIAKSIEAAAVDLTATGGLIGTPAYLAPERVDGHPATPASDLYSAGVVLYEALSGCKPFEADTPLVVAQMIRDQEPVPLRSLCPDLDPTLVDAIERAMDKDPSSRFSSAAEMSRAVAADSESTVPHSHDGSAVATSGTRVLPVPPRQRRRAPVGWLVAGAGALVVVLALGIASLRDSGGSSSVPETTTPTTVAGAGTGAPGASLPAELDDALERLEESVQP